MLDKWTVRWIESWFKEHAQKGGISGTKFIWRWITSGVPRSLLLGPILFNIFINDVDHWNVCTVSKFAADTKPGGMADISDGCGTCGSEGHLKAGEMIRQEPSAIQRGNVRNPASVHPRG